MRKTAGKIITGVGTFLAMISFGTWFGLSPRDSHAVWYWTHVFLFGVAPVVILLGLVLLAEKDRPPLPPPQDDVDV